MPTMDDDKFCFGEVGEIHPFATSHRQIQASSHENLKRKKGKMSDGGVYNNITLHTLSKKFM